MTEIILCMALCGQPGAQPIQYVQPIQSVQQFEPACFNINGGGRGDEGGFERGLLLGYILRNRDEVPRPTPYGGGYYPRPEPYGGGCPNCPQDQSYTDARFRDPRFQFDFRSRQFGFGFGFGRQQFYDPRFPFPRRGGCF